MYHQMYPPYLIMGICVVGVSCSVHKARCCWSSGIGKKKQVSLRHGEPRPQQQDLDNYILLCKTNGIRKVLRKILVVDS